MWIQQKVREGSVELRKVRGDQNPADLFTKHLASNDKIKELLRLLGCEHATGRAALAPKLREATGTQKGELLEIQKEVCEYTLMAWDGHEYPKGNFDGEDVPEAFEYDVSVLPHYQADLESIFPRAVAIDPMEDRDPHDNCDLEKRGAEIGRQAL